MDIEGARMLAAGICMGLGAIGPAIGEGIIAGKAMESIGRNPQTSDKILPNMITSMAIAESTGIYALIVALLILFVV